MKKLLHRFRKPIEINLNKARQVPQCEHVLNGKMYRSMDAKCIAQGQSTPFAWGWLMQTNKGNFFVVNDTILSLIDESQSSPWIVELEGRDKALEVYYHAPIQEVPFSQAFPDLSLTDA